MLHFQKLKIQGFKSFVDKTELLIEPGLTGIVGPNGCGKSNVVEALRWAMGETSARRLRGGEMADVIFAGTQKRPARNLAEVSIDLDNSQRLASAAFNHADSLTISRKIDRDKGSTYRINGQEVRARDVQLLFTDTASGAGSTALVGQGKLNAIITAKPSDRRILLEEAAGIGGLRTRRHDAQLRLKNAETNLASLDQVLSDMLARRRDLLRQAKQAETYRSLSEKQRELALKITALEWFELAQALAQAKQQLDQAQAANAQAQAQAGKAQTIVTTHTEALEPLKQDAQTAALVLNAKRLAREQSKAALARVAALHDAAHSNLAQIDKDQQATHAVIQQAHVTLSQLAHEAKALGEQGTQEHKQAELAQALKDAQEDMRRLEASVQDQQQQKTALTTQRQSLATQIERQSRDVQARQAKLDSAQRDLVRQERQKAEAGDLTRLEALYAEQSDSLRLAWQEEQAQEAGIEQARDRHQEAREKAQTAQQALSSLDAQITSLQRMLTRDKSGKPSAKHIALAQDIHTPADLSLAVAAVMGAGAQLPEISGDDNASPISAGWLKLADVSLSAPSVGTPLVAALKLPAALQRRFQAVSLVDSPTQALAALPQLLPGQACVTRDGWLLSWDGLICDPQAADRALAERLQLQQQLTELNQARPALQEQREATQTQAQAHSKALDEQETALRACRAKRQALQHALLNTEKQLAQQRKALEGVSQAITALNAQIEQATLDLTQAQTDLDERKAELALLPDTAGLDQSLVALSRELQAARQQVGRARSAVEEQRLAETRRKDRLTALERERDLWTQRQVQAQEQTGSFEQRRGALNQQITDLQTEQSQHSQALASLEIEAAQAEQAHAKLIKQLQDQQVQTDSFARTAKEAAKAAQQAEAEVIRAETRLDGLQETYAKLKQSIQDRHGMTPEGVLAQSGVDWAQVGAPADLADKAALPDRQALAKELEDIKSRRARLGAVNLQAAEQAETLTSQSSEYEAEKAEIEQAIAKLRRTITTINKEARGRVIEAFHKIDTQFSGLFEQLFGGGKAHLQLVESDDPLEAGLELFAQPPGKKLQALSLLSGGEQTMSAIALLFAVFLVNPAPICVLDEVDAPLDEANVERYCAIVRRMAETTQTRFLIVTHHPVSMARMDRLYGVTMQERGVSTLVSLDLNAAEALVA